MKILPLDKLFSEYIRKRAMQKVGGCERCLTPKLSWKDLQCSHFHGRRKRSVRWNPDNGAGLCGACHMYFGSNPLEHIEFFWKKLGEEKFELLNIQAQMVGVNQDIQAITLYLKSKLEELDNEDTNRPQTQ